MCLSAYMVMTLSFSKFRICFCKHPALCCWSDANVHVLRSLACYIVNWWVVYKQKRAGSSRWWWASNLPTQRYETDFFFKFLYPKHPFILSHIPFFFPIHLTTETVKAMVVYHTKCCCWEMVDPPLVSAFRLPTVLGLSAYVWSGPRVKRFGDECLILPWSGINDCHLFQHAPENCTCH